MRARNIKPGFFENELLSELDPLARILFAGLWCYCDKEGRFEWRPKRIKALILPYDNCDIEKLLMSLHAATFICMYLHENEKYGYIPNFKRHQNPHPHEAKSRLPAPSEKPEQSQCHDMSITLNEMSVKCNAESLNPESLNPESFKKTPCKKKKVEPDATKIVYAENVTMTPDEHSKLIAEHGEALTFACIAKLSNYKGANGKTYKSDYKAILSWVVDEVKKKFNKVEPKTFTDIRSEKIVEAMRDFVGEG